MFIYLDISFLSFSILTLAKLGHTYCHSLIGLILIPFALNSSCGPTETHILPFSYCSCSYSFRTYLHAAVLLLVLFPFLSFSIQLWPNWNIHTAILLLLLISFLSFSTQLHGAQLRHKYCHSPIALNLIPFVLNTAAWGPTET